MKAVVFHAIGEIGLDDVPEPRIEASADAIVRITSSAICGTDLHITRNAIRSRRERHPCGRRVEEAGRRGAHRPIGSRERTGLTHAQPAAKASAICTATSSGASRMT